MMRIPNERIKGSPDQDRPDPVIPSMRQFEVASNHARGFDALAPRKNHRLCLRRRLRRLSHLLLGVRQRCFQRFGLGAFRLADRFLQRARDRLIDRFRRFTRVGHDQTGSTPRNRFRSLYFDLALDLGVRKVSQTCLLYTSRCV